MKNFFSKFENTPVAVKASIAFFIGTIITKALVYLTMPIYTRLMDASEFGQASVYYTWQNVLGIFAMFCLSKGVFNVGMADFPNDRDEYSFSMLSLSFLCTIIFAIVFIIIYPYVYEWIDIPLPLLVLMGMTFLCMPAYQFWMVKQRYEFKYKSLLLWTVILAVVSPLTAVICLLLFPQKALFARLLGAEGSHLVIYFLFVLYLVYKSNCKVNTKYWKAAVLFNLPLIPHYLSVLILGSSDRIMISKLVGDAEAAYYTVAYNISIAMTVVWSAVNSSLIPYTYEKCKVQDFKSISKVTNVILTAFACIVILFSLFAPEAIKLMATDEYMDALFVVPPIVCSVFFQVQYFIYANIVYYYKKPTYVMIASVTAALLNIVLNYLLIPVYGYYIAGFTTLLCYILQAMIDYHAMKKAVGHDVYNIKYIILLSSVVLFFIIFVSKLYPYNIIRYVVLTISLCLIYQKRESVFSYYRALKK